MSWLLMAGLLYAAGATAAAAWFMLALRRNEVLRARYADVAEVVGWPALTVAIVLFWPMWVAMVTIWGEPKK